MKADELARPLLSLIVVEIRVPVLENVPLAPEEGAVKVTVTPGTAEPLLSITYTARGFEKVAPGAARWLSPPA